MNKTREDENNEKSDETRYTFPEKYEIIINRAQIKRLEESEIGLLKEVLEIMIDKQDKNASVNLPYSDRKKVKTAMAKVKNVKSMLKTEYITGTNILMRAAADAVAECMNHKLKEINKKKEIHWRKTIIENHETL